MTLRKTFMVLHHLQWRQLLRLAQYRDGARRSRRFNEQSAGGGESFNAAPFGTLKRRERRAPLAPDSRHSIWRASIKASWPNPKGIVSSSPGLRGTSYPGSALQNPTNPNGVAAIPQGRLLRLVQYGDGARASARFNAQSCGAHKTPSPLAVWTLKRRERRAPLAPLPCHSVSGGSITCQHRPQPRWGCDSPAAFSQGSFPRCGTTLGFELESLWDSHRRLHRK